MGKFEAIEGNDKTPIEILLQVGTDGTVSARNVYKFLELAEGQFSRWSKKKIEDNEFAVENEDYIGFDTSVEGNIVSDYKLTIAFAKKLCMQQKNERGEQARNYFITVEEALKKLAQTKLHEPYDSVKAFSLGEVANILKIIVSTMNKQQSSTIEIAEQVQLTCSQFGIKTIKTFVKHMPRQLTIDDSTLFE